MAHEGRWSGGSVYRRPGYEQRLNPRMRAMHKGRLANLGALGNGTADLVPPLPVNSRLGANGRMAISTHRATRNAAWLPKRPVQYQQLRRGAPLSQPTDPFTFTGADGASWGTGWVFTFGTGDVLTNRGRLVTGTGAYDGPAVYYDTALADVDFRIDLEIPTTDQQYPEVRMRFDTTTYDFVRLIFDPGAGSIVLQSFDNDAFSAFLDSEAFTWAANDIIHIRGLVEGTSHKVRVWKNADPEPGTWNLEGTSSLGAGQTKLMLRTVTSNLGVAVTNYWDNWSFGVPPSGLNNIIIGMDACIV